MISELVDIFSNLSELNNNDKTRDLFFKKDIGKLYLKLCTNILNKNNEAGQAIPALKSLKKILDLK